MLKVYLAFYVELAVVASIAVSLYLTRFKRMNCTFNYRITDIWAATLALTPTMLLAGYLSQRDFPVYGSERVFTVSGVTGVGIFQIAGLAIGRMDLEIRRDELGPATAWTSAVSIFAGATFGLFAAGLGVPLLYSIAQGFR